MKRRKRLPDGSLGPLESVFDNKKNEPTIEELQKQLLELQKYIIEKELENLLIQGGM